jgi:hypothetical protein
MTRLRDFGRNSCGVWDTVGVLVALAWMVPVGAWRSGRQSMLKEKGKKDDDG